MSDDRLPLLHNSIEAYYESLKLKFDIVHVLVQESGSLQKHSWKGKKF